MSFDKELTPMALALRIAGAVAIVAAAAALGLLLGKVTQPDLLPGNLVEAPEAGEAPAPAEGNDETEAPPEPEAPREPPPILLHLGIQPDSAWDIIDAEVAYAAEAGIHEYMIPAGLTWGEDEADPSATASIERIIETDPEARFVLQLNFNPPASWYETNPEARMGGTLGEEVYPSPASEAWMAACREAIDRLHGQLADASLNDRVQGFALYGLMTGNWQWGPGVDASESNTAAFRAWLARTYNDDEALRDSWERGDAALDSAEIPEPDAGEATPEVFYDLDADQPLIDYRRFAADTVADAIGALSGHLRELAGGGAAIWAHYGHTFEKSNPANGHLALIALLESDVDGFISAVSEVNRGIGGTGGFMGPVDSARAHGKTWVLVDDTRTGIALNRETGEIEQMRGLRAEDVHNVQRRNFTMAAIHGLTLVWSDPDGEGFLHDDEQWEVFGQLYDIYRTHGDAPAAPAVPEEDSALPPGMGTRVHHPMAQVFIDEGSQFLTRPAAGLDPLLSFNRDVLLASGVSTEFYLLDDLIEGRVPYAPVYIFLNAYHIDASDVKKLHARFAEEKATAIWIYAPGYLDVTMNKNNVRDTVAMNIRAFDEPSPGGSAYVLSGGQWIEQGHTFGEGRLLSPLFYIDDPEADVLAQFQQTEKPSVAMRTMEAGWTSVFIAEPRLSAPLIREILRILEQPVYFRPGKERFFDTAFIRRDLIAIHAEESGERIVNLSTFYDIVDLFDSTIGWPEKESFVLNFDKGETRLFHLTPP